MPLLVILFLTATCLPFEWPEPRLSSGASLAAIFVILTLTCSVTLSVWVTQNAGNSNVGPAFYKWRRRLFFANILGTSACIWLGWGWEVQSAFLVRLSPQIVLTPFAELLIPSPYLFVIATNWIVYYFPERALHRTQLATKEPFWSLSAFVFFQARQFAFLILLPITLTLGLRTVATYSPETAHEWWFHLLTLLFVAGLFVFLPALARPVLGLRAMPHRPERDSLLATASRVGSRIPLLLWPTRNAVANAMILGVIPPMRYVVFTDRILELLPRDELDAVYGHELGHAYHRHLPYYTGFLVLSVSALALFLSAIFGAEWEVEGGWGPLTLLAGLGLYLFVVFGFVSRVCERQADVDGARTVSCGAGECQGHTSNTILGNGRGPVCATGARTMARALERVVLAGGGESGGRWWKRLGAWVKAWQHGPVSARVDFLHRLAEKPALADRHDRFAFRVRSMLALLLLAILLLSTWSLGWDTVLTML